MTTNDLMLGDWVKYTSPAYIKVANITKKKVGFHIKPNEPRIHYVRTCEVEPIPLTPEILEKNGFVLNAKDEIYSKYVQVNEKEQYIITYRIYQNSIKEVKSLFRCELYFDGGINKIHNCSINYVHELQHALKLCGIKKGIVL